MDELNEVASWEELGQWCWVQMLCLKRSWQTELPTRCGLPTAEFEESIDAGIRRLLHTRDQPVDATAEDQPWILARLQFGSGLLQPKNLRLLKIPKLIHSVDALCFLLLEEWYDSGRELWPVLAERLQSNTVLR